VSEGAWQRRTLRRIDAIPHLWLRLCVYSRADADNRIGPCSNSFCRRPHPLA